VQGRFCAHVLPAVERHARVAFRDVRNRSRREELTADAVALAWKWHLSLTQKGKDPAQFPCQIATYAALHARAGRRVAGQDKATDALSPVAQYRHGFTAGTLPACSSLSGNPLEEALHDDAQTPVPDQAAFRLDFPAWLAGLGDRHRRIAEAMAVKRQFTFPFSDL
jgi:DNA-directed RNA polymerase specialized sigma24 family protein